MLAVLSYCPKDQEQAARLAAWSRELGGCPGHELLLVRDTRCVEDDAIVLDLMAVFDHVEALPFVDHFNTWPAAPNACFSLAARHIGNTRADKAFLWLEPDVVPLRAGWLDAIAEEYTTAGKLFLGDYVNVPNVEPHMSGIGVYPSPLIQHAGAALIAGDVAFDVVGAPQILPQMHRSALVHHSWKHEPFAHWHSFETEVLAFKPGCVLFHADKNGSLYPLLRARNHTPPVMTTDEVVQAVNDVMRERNNLSGGVESRHAAVAQHRPSSKPDQLHVHRSVGTMDGHSGSSAPPAQFTCDIFIKTYPPDYEWLSYCLRSIDRFASGFRKVVVVSPEPVPVHMLNLRRVEIQVVVTPQQCADGYLDQQLFKLNAHQFSDADFILELDSDTILTTAVTPKTYVREFWLEGTAAPAKPFANKPIWLITPYDASNLTVPWREPTEKFIGGPVAFEFMRRAPFLIPRWAFAEVESFCQRQHRLHIGDYIARQPLRAFSEYNALGAFLYAQHREAIAWVDTAATPPDQWPALTVDQRWSYGGLTDETRAEFERILAEPASPIMQTKEGIWVLRDDTHISRWVEEHGSLYHDQQTLPLVLGEIHEGDYVVDVGAFIGDTIVPFAERVGANGMVFGFEPNPSAYECLVQNAARFCGDNVKIQRAAAGEGHGILNLSLGPNAGASFLHKGEGITVDVVPIDAMNLTQCALIKLDCEGYELRALQGAEQTINRFHPKLLIEVNAGALQRQGTSPRELFAWLKAHGYAWHPVQELHVADPPQYDVLCKWVGEADQSLVSGSHLNKKSLGARGLERDDQAWLNKPAIEPWESMPETMTRVRELATELKRFCGQGRRTTKVREELRAAGVIR